MVRLILREREREMESEALELFYKEAMRVKEEKGRLANWFKCKCPEYAENQFYASNGYIVREDECFLANY